MRGRGAVQAAATLTLAGDSYPPAVAYRSSDIGRVQLAGRLRKLRSDMGMTIAEVAEKTGLSSSFVSLVETGRSDISIGRLIRLADFYGLSLVDLFDMSSDTSAATSAPADFARTLDHLEGVHMTLLENRVGSHSGAMIPLFVTYERGTAMLEPSLYTGETFIYVLSGRFRIGFGDGATPDVRLSTGESAYLDASVPHTFHNDYRGSSTLLSVVLPAAHRRPPAR